MLTDSTVLILGAGSSVPYGFPTMDQLRTNIINNFTEQYVKLLPNHISESDRADSIYHVNQFIKRFDGSNLIIDEFLSEPDNSDIKQIGKLSIICSLAEFEKNSGFRENSKYTDSDWYRAFYLKLFRSLPINEKHKFWKHNFKIITFNYERSFEHFLFDSLVKTFNNRFDEIKSGLNDIEVIHVYGRMARLEWQFNTEFDDDEIYISYGKIESVEQYKRCTKNIEIMYTSRKDNSRIKRVKEIVSQARRILFIGFGFDQFNLNNLGITNDILEFDQQIIWTQYRLENSKKEFINNLLEPDGTKRIAVNGNAKELIDNYLL